MRGAGRGGASKGGDGEGAGRAREDVVDSARLPSEAFDLSAGEVEARFRWARERGHPAWLWPETTPAAWRAGLEEIGRVTAAVLSGDGEPAELRATAGGAVALGIAAYTSGTGPLLGYWLETRRLRAPSLEAAVLRLHLEHARRRSARMREALRTALDGLGDEGLTPVLLKSAHTGPAYFPEASLRPAADIDLAVDPADFERAEAALRRAGCRLQHRQPRPRQSTWVPPGAPTRLRTLSLVHADDPFTIDLHATLDRGFFGVRTVRFGDVGRAAGSAAPINPRATTAAAGGDAPEASSRVPTDAAADIHASVRVLEQPHLLAYLAVHASEGLHNVTLLRLVELALVIRADAAAGRLNWDEVAGLLERLDAARFAYPALELTERLIPGSVDPAVRARLEAAATPRMRRVLRRLDPATAQTADRLSLEERLMWARGPVEHARRLLYMLWPAWIGGSGRELRRIYAERFYRVIRRRVGWGRES